MKKILILTVSIITIYSLVIFSQPFWGGNTLSQNEVKKKWGSENLDYSKFKNSPDKIKAKMAYSIMTDKKLIGKSHDEIREIFGNNDGFYFVDTYPSYIIQRGKNRSDDTWQIVFRMTHDYKVRDIIVHKNCCER